MVQKTKKDFVNDLYLFYRYFIASNYSNSVPAPHIHTLALKLMKLKEGEGKTRLAVSMPPRHPVWGETPVYTVNRGWTTHGELQAGDYVLNQLHKPVKVIKVMPKVKVDNCFVFSNGDKIISGNDHLWKFNDYNNNVTRLFTTKEVMNRETYVGKSYLSNFKIPTKNKLISLIDKYKVPAVEGNCITVDSQDGMYLVGRNGTPTHNSKSSMVTLAFPLWLIFQDPSLNILIVNNSASLSEKFGIQIREYIKKIGPSFGVYLSDVKRSSTHIMFTNKDGELYDGSIRLVGASGSITGQDADYLVIDDPYFGFDDITPSQLQKKINWFHTIILQRLEPSSKLIILHTRWATHDLIGHVRESDKDNYEFVEFSALDKDNNPLWPQRFSTDFLLDIKKNVGERVFQSVYQQKPIDTTSDFFNMKKLKYGFPEEYVQESIARAWDIASSDNLSNNDYTAGVKMARFGDKAVILDLVHGQFGGNTKRMIQNTAFMDTPECHIVIETGVAAAGELLHQEWKNQLPGFIVERAKVSGNKSKVDRATPLQNAIEDGKVYVAIDDGVTRQAFYDELNSFPSGEHDDITDAVSHVYNYLFMNENKKEFDARMEVVFL
ncbi:hypothetical protein [Methanobrevibacter sp.]|uniref:phage terminase large subunit family protein n=1 Tax=Methanobrevibacter sp. TaxID=66852 RepID=UPI00386EB4DB